MKRAPHTSTTPGKRVRVVLRTNVAGQFTALEGKFVEARSRFIRITVGDHPTAKYRIQKDWIEQFIVNPRRAV